MGVLMSKYTVYRLGLSLGTFPSHQQALAFACKHEMMSPLYLMTDYRLEIAE
jgi:hypothetical protein